VGRHIPEQAPEAQVEEQVSLATHSPSTVQTSTAAPEEAQRVAPAVHAAVEASEGASRTGAPPLPEVPPVIPPASVPPPAPDEPPAGPSDCERASARAGSVVGSYLFGSAQPTTKPAIDRTTTSEHRASSRKVLSFEIPSCRRPGAPVASGRHFIQVGATGCPKVSTRPGCPDFGRRRVRQFDSAVIAAVTAESSSDRPPP
jgi:hypothetical protein